ncbi:c-type cytochrome [Paenactinomyces guangxiensis]|uniref:Cytochrome c n=1 Tax=Paenactinomyces guangxiensis TaxID=1490290 RepID=A0A7W1WSQ1_9BACL|nr:cytochrome c [Paenactinomyces guangxiensis]MBA4495353.1 cytochrome c [Paenactinomyces guangxiensis]MBH8592526.1 cytochrome c [Paenactinomyces guangxiensis]
MRKLAIGFAGLLSFVLLAGCNPQQQTNRAPANDTAMEPKDIYTNNCASCHGGNLQGSIGPSLEKIGGKLSKEEIANIIANGTGSMPGQTQISAQQREKLAAWLAEQK